MNKKAKKTENKLNINPSLLKWAREKAFLSIEDVVQLLKIKPQKATKKKPQIAPEEKLELWESGLLSPSLSALKDLARLYQRPLMTFFLPKPPRAVDVLVDFRTVGSTVHQHDTPTFSKLKRRLINLQIGLSNIVQSSEKRTLDLIGCATINDDISFLIDKIRQKINLSFLDQCKAKNEDDLFKIIREKIQQKGIFVILEGDLGSYHTRIEPEEFRGMTITDKYAPLIIINSKDTKTAKLFSLLHEFAHILLGESSISNVSINDNSITPEETFCNKFAAEFLLPQKEFEQKIPNNIKNKTVNEIIPILTDISKLFKVSLTVVARRAYDLRKINLNIYKEIFSIVKNSFKRNKKENIRVDKNKVDKYRLGNVLPTVMEASENGYISLQDASQLLNLNYTRFEKVLMA